MRFFTTLACALGASVSVVSAAHTRGRNALRMAQGLPPLPPRMPTRIDTARRNLPSGISAPLLFDGDFEADSGSPWTYDYSTRSDDPTLCHSGSHCGLIQPGSFGGGRIEYLVTLTPKTDYTLTFYERFQKDPAKDPTDNDVECFPTFAVDGGLKWEPQPQGSIAQPSTTYTQRTAAFTSSSSGIIKMSFMSNCFTYNTGTWLIDDVSVALATPGNNPRRK
ncbi:hypothetical protein DL96DRAFT_1684583 [Flagelloscypha sp. PMI_526]|nr:hypothetical protein DL96DRAFT_1684583 [Flagelloscypha sp. PMI_526]